MTCPHCKESARFVGYRPKTFVSLLDEIRLDRGYYHCDHCGHGHFPWDKLLRLSPQRLTPAAQEVVSLLSVQDSFCKVAERTLYKAAGLRLSESSIQRTTETAGETLGKALVAKQVFGPQRQWEWHRDANGKTCAYVGTDATGILMQGEGGSKAEGHMVNVGMVFNPQPRRDGEKALAMPCDGVRYLAGHTLDELGLLLRRQAWHVGMDAAEQWIALTDGGQGLENFIDVNFPRAVKILDFQHPVGYLSNVACALAAKKQEAEALLATWCHTLKHEGGEKMLAILEDLDASELMTEEARPVYEKARTYFRNHVKRMNYPEYLRNGWQIATGAVESACKTVINQRLCMGGMRWGSFGSDALSHLRALCRSDEDQWDGFWAIANLAA